MWRLASKYLLEGLLCVLLGAIVVVTTGQVIARYLVHAPLAWSEEIARFLLMWLAMLGAAYGFKTGAHFALVFVVNQLGTTHRGMVVVGTGLTMCLFLILFVVGTAYLVQDSMTQVAPASQLPMAVPYSSGIVGGLLMLYYMGRSVWTQFRGLSTDTTEGRQWE